MEQFELIAAFNEALRAINAQTEALMERINFLENSSRFDQRFNSFSTPQRASYPTPEVFKPHWETTPMPTYAPPAELPKVYKPEVPKEEPKKAYEDENVVIEVFQKKERKAYTRKVPRKLKAEKTIFDLLSENGHTLVTPRNTSIVLKYFLDHKEVNVHDLWELIGGPRSLTLHFIRVLKKKNYIFLENGNYIITNIGREAAEKWLESNKSA